MINSNEKKSESENIDNKNTIIVKKDVNALNLNNISTNSQVLENSAVSNSDVSENLNNNFVLNIPVENTIIDNSDNNTTFNCLALTVKKDYKITVVKNIFIKTLKNSCKVAVSFFILNFIKFFM